MNQFDMQRFGKDGMEAAVKVLGVVTRNAQTVTVEVADYAKRSFEQGSAALERLAAAKTLDKAVEIQTEYLKQAYESFVAQSTKMRDLYVGFAREVMGPFEGFVPVPRA